MSDTEDGSFDKEAEKEKLREQLRREEENRRSTEHMSELLLKGATMTNKHCDTCGDPLFRYEGQEFCPTCSQEGAAAQAASDDGAADQVEASSGSGEPTGGESTGIDRVDTGTGIEVAESRSTGSTAPAGVLGTAAPSRPASDVPEDVSAARASLVRKLNTLASQAEATDDLGRSRELLAAAREAAEALAAVDSLRG